MGLKSNNHRGKREIQTDAHNRKPRAGAYWKHLTNRKGRRWGNRIRKQMVDGRMEIL